MFTRFAKYFLFMSLFMFLIIVLIFPDDKPPDKLQKWSKISKKRRYKYEHKYSNNTNFSNITKAELNPLINKLQFWSPGPLQNLTAKNPGFEIKLMNIKDTKYIVYTPICRIPNVEAIREKLKPLKLIKCSNEKDLVSTLYNEKRQQYILKSRENIVEELNPMNPDESVLCKMKLLQKTGDEIMLIEEEDSFDPSYLFVPKNGFGLIVDCHLAQNTTQTIQKDAFPFVQYEKPIETVNSIRGPRKPSVIMLGIDSISRMIFHRTMPLTAAYIARSGWYEMQGYNKIGDNTLPNLLAVLTGYTSEVDNGICNLTEPGCFDRLPFIWKFFKKSNYMTAYGEDISKINTFYYYKPGFLAWPVDYYLRPFMVTIEKLLRTTMHFDFEYCVGRRLSISYVLDYCKQFIQRYIFERPIFGLFWISSFTHSTHDGATALDAHFLEYLRSFEGNSLFNESIVILFSDHGRRFGTIAQSEYGFLENRLPMLFIWLPNWFRKQYPQFAEALKLNQNRLISNYDLHYTLKHIIELGNPQIRIPNFGNCPTCQTLFRPVPLGRDCAQAGIPEHWCACQNYEPVTSEYYSSIVTDIANKIIEKINNYLNTSKLNSLCETLSLQRVISAEYKTLNNHKNNNMKLMSYRIKFEISPGASIYEATVKYHKIRKTLEEFNFYNISTLNIYKNLSYCVHDDIAVNFCVCK